MYVDVILPLPFSNLYTYAVPAGMQKKIDIGYRVIVPFGNRKHYTAVINKIHWEKPKGFKTKEIYSVVDSKPVLYKKQLELWEWISFYYLSPLGDVYKAALPPPMISNNPKSNIRRKTETFIRINPDISKSSISEIIGRAKKQQSLFDSIDWLLTESSRESLPKKDVTGLPDYSYSAINGLLQKKLLQTFDIETVPANPIVKPTEELRPLNRYQQKAFNEINNCFEDRESSLLYGTASSAKSEIYLKLIEQFLNQDMQVLFLMPEIAHTTELTGRLQALFGTKLGIYHSKINDNERVEVWQKMLSDNPYKIIVGVRSSLFLPFQRLGLIIIDDEHEVGYKQQDPAPRYHARDTAVMLAHLSNAKTLLGSATPSLESYHNASSGKYGLVRFKKGRDEIAMPLIKFENTSELRKRRKMKSLLAPALLEEMNATLKRGEQVILLRNRRGFASLLECEQCGWRAGCSRCDVTLTYHKQPSQLICHYCNSTYQLAVECPNCHSNELKRVGYGTEQLEEEVAKLFPNNVVARMDLDTTRKKRDYEQLVNSFQKGEIEILIATQIISKNIDFSNVTVIGIVLADSILSYPDFRSHERGFQLFRDLIDSLAVKDRKSTVIIQSSDPNLPFYKFVKECDWEGFSNSQLLERKLFKYPPYYRLIKIIIKERVEKKADAAAQYLADRLRESLHEQVLGPNKALIGHVQLYYIREILLKLDGGESVAKVRKILIEGERLLRQREEFRWLKLHYDVDPI